MAAGRKTARARYGDREKPAKAPTRSRNIDRTEGERDPGMGDAREIRRYTEPAKPKGRRRI